MRSVIPSANNGENEAAIPAEEQNDSSFKYEATLRSLSALGWSSYLRQLSEMNFVQLYDYLVVSTRKNQHKDFLCPRKSPSLQPAWTGSLQT